MPRRFTSLWFVNFGGRNAVEPDRYVSNLNSVAISYVRHRTRKGVLRRYGCGQQEKVKRGGQKFHGDKLTTYQCKAA